MSAPAPATCMRGFGGITDMLRSTQEWHFASANFALYAAVCALTFAFGGLDPVTLIA